MARFAPPLPRDAGRSVGRRHAEAMIELGRQAEDRSCMDEALRFYQLAHQHQLSWLESVARGDGRDVVGGPAGEAGALGSSLSEIARIRRRLERELEARSGSGAAPERRAGEAAFLDEYSYFLAQRTVGGGDRDGGGDATPAIAGAARYHERRGRPTAAAVDPAWRPNAAAQGGPRRRKARDIVRENVARASQGRPPSAPRSKPQASAGSKPPPWRATSRTAKVPPVTVAGAARRRKPCGDSNGGTVTKRPKSMCVKRPSLPKLYWSRKSPQDRSFQG